MENHKSWSEESSLRQKNRKWLKYSSNIARRILAAIEGNEKIKNQTDLAKLVGVKQQQISKILQGRENLTLETIANLSTALGTELISFPSYKDSFIYFKSDIKPVIQIQNLYLLSDLHITNAGLTAFKSNDDNTISIKRIKEKAAVVA